MALRYGPIAAAKITESAFSRTIVRRNDFIAKGFLTNLAALREALMAVGKDRDIKEKVLGDEILRS